MEKKEKLLQAHLVVYKRQLKEFLAIQSYLTELDFIESEIPVVKHEIERFNNILAIQRKNKTVEKLSDEYIPIWLSSYKEFLFYLEKRKSILEKPDRKKLQSFSWTGSKEEVEKLFADLVKHGFIDPKTDLQAFTTTFTDNLINCRVIKWRASNKLLSYLFNQMYASNLIVKEWQFIIEKFKLFQNKTGKYLTAQDLASALSSINDSLHGLNPKGSDKIDLILKNIKTG
ncbi:MAG: hypothetical protein NTX61_18725 [Bacteroidetes bacterium]|nr:hypothetical protein [Bacteroidota bacterium]